MAIALMPPSALTAVTVAASSVATQSHSTLLPEVRSNSARWPMAKPAPMPITPASYSRKAFMWLCDSAASVVQLCPRAGTYCRSSSQIAHCAGGWSLSAYCMPQAVQMKWGTRIPVFGLCEIIKSQRFAAPILLRRGGRRLPSSRPRNGEGEWSAGWRTIGLSALRRARVLRSTRSPLGAPWRRFLSPGPYFRARTGALWPPIRAAFAALRSRRVQPFKADPRSGAGRRPRASRVRGCEPRPRAPLPTPTSRTPLEAPLMEQVKEYKHRNLDLSSGNARCDHSVFAACRRAGKQRHRSIP